MSNKNWFGHLSVIKFYGSNRVLFIVISKYSVSARLFSKLTTEVIKQIFVIKIQKKCHIVVWCTGFAIHIQTERPSNND